MNRKDVIENILRDVNEQVKEIVQNPNTDLETIECEIEYLHEARKLIKELEK